MSVFTTDRIVPAELWDSELTTGHFRVGVLAQVGVQHGVTDLVTHLVYRQSEKITTDY